VTRSEQQDQEDDQQDEPAESDSYVHRKLLPMDMEGLPALFATKTPGDL
jgi:hypothetical protein